MPRKRRRRMVGKKFEDSRQREAEQEVEHLERELHREWRQHKTNRPEQPGDGDQQAEDE